MKYLLLLLMLLLLSCSSSKRQSIADIYTTYSYHKSSSTFNLKGSVKEVRYTSYKVSGDSLSFEIGIKDEENSIKGDLCYRFNREGYITYRETGHSNSSYRSKEIKIVEKNRFDSVQHILQNEVFSRTVSYTEEQNSDGSYKTNVVEEPYNTNSFTFKGDTISMSDLLNPTEKPRVITFQKKDSLLLMRYRDEENKTTLSHDYIEIKGYGYQMKKEELFGERLVSTHKLTKDKRLIEWITWISVEGDSAFFCEHQYNRFGDHCKVTYAGTNINSNYWVTGSDQSSRYLYDKHNNWIEKVQFVNGKAVTAVRREISYY